MRKIQNIAFVLLATLFAGCINDHIENTFCRDGVLTLNLSTSAVGTRADGTMDDGGDSYHPEESTIYDIQLFLYPANSTEKTPAVYATKIDVKAAEKPNHDTTEQTVTVPAGAINKLCPNPGDKCDIYVIVNYYEQMKEDLTAGFTDATSTREYLKGRPLKTEFVEIDEEFGDVWAPRSFVMDSDKNVDGQSKPYTVTRKEDNSLESETIYVTRAAAKIAIEICVESFTDAEGNRWEALTDVKEGTERYMTLDFFNGVKEGIINDNSHIDATGKDIAVSSISDGTYYSVSNLELLPGGLSNDIQPPLSDNTEGTEGSEGSEGTEGSTSTAKYFVPEARLYSYTTAWGSKDVTNSDETYDPNADAPHFKLSIPWKKTTQNSESWVTYNYTVPIGLGLNQLVRNKLYVIRLHVSALGNLNYLDESVYSYKVCDWDDVTVNATLTRPKYFVVEEEYVEIYNKDSYSVDFSASDIVSAEIVSIIKPDYSAEIPQEYEYIYGNANSDSGLATVDGSGFSGNTEDFEVNVDEKNNKITLSHTLVNNMSSTSFDYVPYTVKVKATMTITDSAGKETYMVRYITFKQYPAIYIYADTNASFVSTESSNADNNNPANTFVNGWNRPGGSETIAPGVTIINNQNPTKAGTVYGYYGSSNHNPNQYVITVSSLDSSLPYIIADPRSRTSDVSSLNIGTIATSYAVDYDFNLTSEQHQLQYYYPTNYARTDGSTTLSEDAKDYVTGYHIAPKYRIASSYSVTSGVNTLQIARQRCATYQENGYPAGRWRMPTYAEVAFISLMSHREIIPRLFDEGESYWCAHGQFVPDDEGNVNLGGSGSISIRCVYDEWYWGSERLSTDTSVTPNYSQFVWGDMKIW